MDHVVDFHACLTRCLNMPKLRGAKLHIKNMYNLCRHFLSAQLGKELSLLHMSYKRDSTDIKNFLPPSCLMFSLKLIVLLQHQPLTFDTTQKTRDLTKTYDLSLFHRTWYRTWDKHERNTKCSIENRSKNFTRS